MKHAKRLVSLSLIVLAAACSKSPPPAATVPQAAAPAPAAPEPARPAAAPAGPTAAQLDSMARERQRDSVRAQVASADTRPRPAAAAGLSPADAAALADAIHFDLDRSDIRDEDVASLQRKLRILQANRTMTIQIEGHCDERGADEYNLALGLRRAAAVKRWLVSYGIRPDRIRIVSYGEERPADPAHTEDAWARNRRAEFVVTNAG